MQVVSVAYASPGEDSVTIVTDGATVFAPWPIQSWHRGPVQAWLAAGNSISAYVPPVPSVVSKLQLVRELRARSLWGPFKAALAQNTTNQEDWELANTIERGHPRTEEMGAAFGLDAAGIDQLFLDASAR